MTDYLTMAEVLAIHADQIERCFEKLVPWLHDHVVQDPLAAPRRE